MSQLTHAIAIERGLQWTCDAAVKMREIIKHSPMAPKTKPDPASLARLKELRQAAELEKKLKILEKERKTKPDPVSMAMLKELRQAAELEKKLKILEKMRREAPHEELPTQKPKGKKTVR